MPDEAPNLLSSLRRTLVEHGALGACRRIDLRTREQPFADARLIMTDARGARDAGAPSPDDLALVIGGLPEVASVRRQRSSLSIRLTDEFVADLGDRLASGRPSGLDTAEILQGRPYVVGFVGPNVSKALHVGHLRNICVGHALASALTAAGADVLRESLVSDIGRNTAEAMGGLMLEHAGETPSTRGIKSDHFVSICYGDYLRRTPPEETAVDGAPEADPNAREAVRTGDFADQLLTRWMRGDAEVRRTWTELREWVMRGHRETLDRLGVGIEREDLESTAFDQAVALVERGVQDGVLVRGEDGAVFYEAGRAEFARMVLLRGDGFPTGHTRMLAIYQRILDGCAPGTTYIDVCGTEWEPAYRLQLELMRRLCPTADVVQMPFHHELVTFEDGKVSSSDGAPLLIDELIDRLASAPPLVELVERGHGGDDAGRTAIAALVVKTLFVCHRNNRVLRFSWDALLDAARNPGWDVARAFCIARTGAAAGRTDAEPGDNAYRLGVLRSQAFPRTLEHAVGTLDLSGLTTFLVAVSREFLACPNGSHGVAHRVLQTVLSSLGLLPPARSGDLVR